MDFVQSFAVQPIRYREARRDQRLLLPHFHAVVDGHILPAVNWSLGGLLLQGKIPPGLQIALLTGVPVTGVLCGETRLGLRSVSFTAAVTRLEPSPQRIALRFADANGQVVDFLEECLCHLLSRRTDR